MADDFTQCMVSNSRMAARAITRRYDSYVRPYGVTATQLSLMGAIRMLPGSTVSALAVLVEKALIGQATTDEITAALERLDQLSNEDIKTVLLNKGRLTADLDAS